MSEEIFQMQETPLPEQMNTIPAKEIPPSTSTVPEQEPKKRFKAINRNQLMMRPVDVEKLVEEDHPVRAIWAMVCQLDWSRFVQDVKVVEGGQGRSSHDPRLLAALWLYAYSEGVSAARELSRMCAYEPGCQWLTGMEEVNYHSLSDFRAINKEAQDDVFKQVLGVLSAEGLTDMKRVMQDGTKIRAQAAGKSFRGEATLQKHLRLAQEQIEAMGSPNSEESSQRTMQAKQRAAREKKQRLEQALKELKKLDQEREWEKGARVSESDPEARKMKQAEGGFAPSYNVQICTEASNKIIVAVEATQAGTDYDELIGGIVAVEANTGKTPQQMVVDGGYIKNANIEYTTKRGIDLIGPIPETNAGVEASMKKRGVSPEFYPDKFRYDESTNSFTCPAEKMLTFRGTSRREGRLKHQYKAKATDCESCAFHNQCCPKTSARILIRKEDSEAVKAFRAKMQTEQAKHIYRSRAEIAETPNAWIKATFGLRQFRLRGLRKVGMEAVWACLTYNILQWTRLIWRSHSSPVFATIGA
jgi:transposase